MLNSDRIACFAGGSCGSNDGRAASESQRVRALNHRLRMLLAQNDRGLGQRNRGRIANSTW
ncbi:hypothetical protein, partial [Mesorhizobium sp.]|uniref:hypothetical protein n=1 Tax=Mesorhizobium sp. TaxID=1871066 RepID=UPI0025FA67C2